MKFVATNVLVALYLTINAVVDARIGGSYQRSRKLQHRKLHWAPDDVGIPDTFIVFFKRTGADEQKEELKKNMRTANDTTEVAAEFKSAVTLKNPSLTTLMDALEHPSVSMVVQDAMEFFESDTGSQVNPGSWGLDRIDQANLPLDETFAYGASGSGVQVYILDSGIRTTHTEFVGRITCGYNSLTNTTGSGCEDNRGHGTHIAGTIGGKQWGVAKDATLIAVKVLNDYGGGSLSSIIGGINYVIERKLADSSVPMVINLSISGLRVTPGLDAVIDEADEAGIIVVAAAGNNGIDACDISPASATGSITVGATGLLDERGAYSNFGSCVDIFAPGTLIFSAAHHDDYSGEPKTGTSMAAAHVAGAVAMYLELQPTLTRADIIDKLRADATVNAITDVGSSSPNLLLNTRPIQ